MLVYNVIATLPIEENTSVLIDGDGKDFKNGTGVLDDKGFPYEVLSVGMSCGDADEMLKRTSLLIKGNFASEKLYV
ncbi:MAG: hypothetical protein IJX85_11595 [Lachnospiraceae bacterium]|nr:hypothetical protein [Lachnospiraceae bacterium]